MLTKSQMHIVYIRIIQVLVLHSIDTILHSFLFFPSSLYYIIIIIKNSINSCITAKNHY